MGAQGWDRTVAMGSIGKHSFRTATASFATVVTGVNRMMRGFRGLSILQSMILGGSGRPVAA